MIENLKEVITKDYTDIVSVNNLNGDAQRDTVCGPIYEPIRDKYASIPGYIAAADLGLSCGFPFAHSGIEKGDVVLDLGCAAGIDSFIAGEMTGENGKVLGIDITQALVHRANKIAHERHMTHIYFEVDDIEKLDRGENWADVVITNGVFSLLPDLDSAFAKAYQALKPSGVFCMADITKNCKFTHDTYARVKKYTGCLNGIRLQQLYLDKMTAAGFKNIKIVAQRQVALPEEVVPLDELNGLYITTYKMMK
jgi:2-polyprenyl-3-methyl-5-hydroxy-6-metoxy-1,4-benzoquinol methylase